MTWHADWLVRALFTVCLAVALAAAAPAGFADAERPPLTVLVAAPGDAGHDAIAPAMAASLAGRYRIQVEVEPDGARALERVAADPAVVAVVQRDWVWRAAQAAPALGPRIEFYGNVPACLFLAAPRREPALRLDGLSPEQAAQRRVDIGPDGGAAAQTFAALQALDPGLASLAVERRGNIRALGRVVSGQVDAVLIVAVLPADDGRLGDIAESPDLALVPVAAPALSDPARVSGSPYELRRVEVPRSSWWRSRHFVETTCTAAGFAVNDAAPPALHEDLARLVVAGQVLPEPPSWVSALWGWVSALWERLSAAFDWAKRQMPEI